MRTAIIQTKTLQAHHIIAILVGDKRFRLTIFFMLAGFLLFSQQSKVMNPNKTLGVSFSSQVSANGYGMQFLPMLYYREGRSCFFAGPAIQKQKLNFTGVECNYTYSVSGNRAASMDKLELFFFITAAYYKNALLGRSTLLQEELADPSFSENHVQDLHFSSAEAYAGVGLRVPFLKRFNWTSSLGVGGYQSFDFSNVPGLYYSPKSVGLLLRTGIMMDLY